MATGWQTGAKLSMLETWRERASDVRGFGIDCGHFLAEEKPDAVLAALLEFYSSIGAG